MRIVAEQSIAKLSRLERERDNILYLLIHEELSHAETLKLQAQLSGIQDEIVLLRAGAPKRAA